MVPKGWDWHQGSLASRSRGGKGQAAGTAASIRARAGGRRRASPTVPLGCTDCGRWSLVRLHAGGEEVGRGTVRGALLRSCHPPQKEWFFLIVFGIEQWPVPQHSTRVGGGEAFVGSWVIHCWEDSDPFSPKHQHHSTSSAFRADRQVVRGHVPTNDDEGVLIFFRDNVVLRCV
jgi:hypothetical protein